MASPSPLLPSAHDQVQCKQSVEGVGERFVPNELWKKALTHGHVPQAE